MLELDLASARHRILVLRLGLLVGQIETDTVDPATFGDEFACDLGRWLRGPGRRLEHLPEFQELSKLHRHFHERAGEIAQLFAAGDIEAAAAAMEGEYAQCSPAVHAAIEGLKAAARAERKMQIATGVRSERLRPYRYAPGANPALATGIAAVDAQHADIASTINRLLERPHEKMGRAMTEDTLRELGALIGMHFLAEEEIMQEIGVRADRLAQHRHEHQNLLARYRQVALTEASHQWTGLCQTCLQIEHWIVDHVREQDLMLKQYAEPPRQRPAG